MKKAEITSQQIVILIILVVSFVVLLYFLFSLDFESQTSSQLCRNSVLLRGNAQIANTIPLNCKRSYECITKDGSCEGISNPDKVKKIENLDNIYKELADNLAQCWWMFGEGKVDYVGKDLITSNNYCSVCSQIYFDNSVKNIEGIEDNKINKDDFYDYMAKAQMPNTKQTYLRYLFEVDDLNSIKEDIKKDSQIKEITFGNINLDSENHQLIVMGITSENNKWATIGATTGAAISATVLYLTPGINVGAVIGTVIFATSATAGGIAGSEVGAIITKGEGVDNQFMRPKIIEANSDRFKALNCEEIVTRS